jgi:enoyl-[acyl-carrier protein] reductase I
MALSIDMKGKKAIVFGIANEKSIAYAIAKALVEQGAMVACAYQPRVEALAVPAIKSLGSNAIAVQCDVVDEALLESFFERVRQEFERIDYIVHSIAFAKREHLQGKFYETDKRGFDVAQEVSAFSLVEITRRALPIMNNKGSIIALTYLGSERAVPNYNVMGVAKASLESSVRYLAHDLGEQNIRVNAISAGPIPTLAATAIKDFYEMVLNYTSKAPLKRTITAEEVANTALFLLSDLSSGITGQAIYVDGGYNIMGI